MPLSQLESFLSYHLRVFLPMILKPKHHRRLAYVFSLVSAITSGFITIISMYAAPWQRQLHYSSWQINMISSFANVGMYLTPPLHGIVADIHGPITLVFIAILGFIPSYLYVAHAFTNPDIGASNAGFYWTLFCFVVIGLSTTSLYFSSLLTCTKLYPKSKVLSISLPTTCFGLSSLIASQFLRLHWFWDGEELVYVDTLGPYLNLGRVFKAFALLNGIIGILMWMATSTVSLITYKEYMEREQQRKPQDTTNTISLDDNQTETSPLLESSSSGDNNDERDSEGSSTAESESSVTGVGSKLQFLKQPIFYLFALSVLLSLGPLEMFIANMSSLAKVLLGPLSAAPSISSDLLSVYALSSTMARLLAGFFSDYLTSKGKTLSNFLLSLVLLALITQLLILKWSLSPVSPQTLLATGLIFGVAYGGLFTVYPMIVMSVWGQRAFGTVFGFLMLSPALGSIISCMQYASVYDTKCNTTTAFQQIPGSDCISPVYRTTSIWMVCSFLLSVFVLRYWKGRGFNV